MSNNDVERAIKALEDQDGRLIPADVVDAARDPASPLHSHFEWDDGAAAEKYRLDQARTLIRSIKVEVTVRDMPITVVGYVRDPDASSETAGYRNIAVIKADSARITIIDEMKRVSNAVTRAKTIAAVLGDDSDLDQIASLAKGISDKARQQPTAANA